MPEDFRLIEPDAPNAIWRENTHRLRLWNRRYALWLYYHHGEQEHAPGLPELLGEGGVTVRYELPARPALNAEEQQSAIPVGPGPDRYGYYSVTEPDCHAHGDLWQSPADGSVYCLVETPRTWGGFEGRWIKVT